MGITNVIKSKSKVINLYRSGRLSRGLRIALDMCFFPFSLCKK